MAGWRCVLALLVLVTSALPAVAEMRLPGVSADSGTYAGSLTRRYPGGAVLSTRTAAEQVAAKEMAGRSYAAAATALENRLAMGATTPQLWRDLALAQLRRVPPDPQKAMLAAWQGWIRTDGGPAGVPALLLLAEALRAQDRRAPEIEVLQQAVELAPNDPAIAVRLADSRREAGMLVARVDTEGEADPPRACVAFTVAPTARTDFMPGDWVKLEPPVPDAAVTREGDLLCVSGLPSGRITQITMRTGLPGQDGTALKHDAVLPVAMPDRAPGIGFDTRLFVLPRGQNPSVTLSTVNFSAVSLRLIRLSERNVASLLRRMRLGTPVERWTAESLAREEGSEVWSGSAEIAAGATNRTVRTKLPLPEALQTAGPGLFALVATPGDGTTTSDASAVQLLLRTDLAPSVWRGSDGLTVQLRDYGSAEVRGEVLVRLLARNNDILAEAATNGDGVARFAASLLHGEGPLSPAAIQAFAGEDFVTLDLNAAAFDLSDRGVEGLPHPGPLDAFLWADRGIYRPGETVHVMALVRDAAGAPADLPVTVTVRRPNGQVFRRDVPQRGPDASIHLPITLTATAPAGVWNVELRADPAAAPIGRVSFRVDAFVPERLAVDPGAVPTSIVPGQPAMLPFTARFLYGAPGSGLAARANLRLVPDPAPFPSLTGYRIGIEGEVFAPDEQATDLDETDAKGAGLFTIDLKRAPDTTQALKAEIDLAVADPAGRASHAAVSIPVRPATPMIGIKPMFDGGSVDADTEARFEIAAVDPTGQLIAMAARLRLIRERPDWRIVMKGSLARYETVWRDEPLETRDIAIPTEAPLKLARTLPFGRYRLEVSQPGGLAITSLRFRSGWGGSDSSEVPDRVDVSADRRTVPAGESVRVHIAPPFAGQATLLVLSDRVHVLRNVSVPQAGLDVDVPVSETWGPGAYVAVHVFRGGADFTATRPARAIGLVWVGVDPAARKLDMSIDAPASVPARGSRTVVLHGPPGAWVSLAAVDEGILRLTRFVSPDPSPHFLGRRRLGLDIRDDWGRLIAPAEGEAALLRQGGDDRGDDGGFALPDIPQHTLSLFVPPMQIGSDGNVSVSLDLPDFAGSVRLMAVGWQGSRIGAATASMLVRDALVAEPLLPRFLAPGDEARLAVLLQNVDLPGGEAVVNLTVQGPLSLAADRLTANLAPGARAVPATLVRATGAGQGFVRLDVTGPGGFHVIRESAITVRPARGPQTVIAAGELAPGAEQVLEPSIARFLPGTWTAIATIGAAVRYDVAALVQALNDYPLSCLEQAVSRGLPLAMLPDGGLAGPQRMARLQQAVSLVLDRQRFDGRFGLWSGNGEAEPWLSVYAMDFLIRARTAGAIVPDPAMADGLRALAEDADTTDAAPEVLAAQAYRLYVLAAAGQGRPGAARVLMQSLESLPTPMSRAQLGAALALAHDQPRAEAAFEAALVAGGRGWWTFDYGSAVRDQFAITVLLKESGLLPQRLAKLVAALPGSDLTASSLNTQEQAWAIAAAAALGRDGRPVHVALGSKDLTAPTITAALDAKVTLRNLGDRPVWRSLATTGVPMQAPAASRAGMRISRRFLTPDGATLNLDQLRQNTVFVLLLEGKVEDGQAHRVMLLQGLPAGWEIVGRIAAGSDNGPVPGPVPSMAWIGQLTEPEAQPAADDRFAAIVSADSAHPDIRLAVRLRAVTPGSFALPGAELADMYRPAVAARGAEARIKVLSADP